MKAQEQKNIFFGKLPKKYYIILYDSSVFFGPGFHNPNNLEIKKDTISKFLAPMIQNILNGNFQTS